MTKLNLKVLEDKKRYKKVDSEGFYKLIDNFHLQLQEAVNLAQKWKFTINEVRPLNIVVAGMGGSAIGADLVRSFLVNELNVPFQVIRHYRLPKFVGPQSLVFVSSYSGNTEETLAVHEEVLKRGALTICISSGGKLVERARQPYFRSLQTELGEIGSMEIQVEPIVIPSEYPPRAALGFSFVALLVALNKVGLVKDYSSKVLQVADFLSREKRNWEVGVPFEKNEAKKLATGLFEKIPLIYAGSDFLEPVAVRWKGQICENTKQPAFYNFFPEFNHNELVGFGVLKHLTGKLAAVFLQDKDDHPRVSLRMQIVEDILKRKKIPVQRVASKGETVLERMFYTILLGDFVSYYLAILNGVDPKPVEIIDYLKERLEKT